MCKALNKSLQSRIQELEEVVNNQAKIIQQMQESRNIGPLTNDTLRAHLSHFSETMEQKFNHQLFCVKQQLESSINQKFGTYAEVAGKTQSHDTGAHVSPSIPTPLPLNKTRQTLYPDHYPSNPTAGLPIHHTIVDHQTIIPFTAESQNSNHPVRTNTAQTIHSQRIENHLHLKETLSSILRKTQLSI